MFLLSKTSDIVMAMFDLGSQMTMTAGGAIYHEAGIPDVWSDVITIHAKLDAMTTGELWSFVFETMFAKLLIRIMSVLITVIMYGRMIEIYLYVSCAPIPFATLGNKEWGSIGTNYIKSIFALALQGFFIIVVDIEIVVLVSSLKTFILLKEGTLDLRRIEYQISSVTGYQDGYLHLNTKN